MAAGRIKLTPAELRTSATKYSKGATDIRTILSTLQKEQSVISGNWEGSSFQKFDAQFNSLVPKVKDFATLLDDIKKQLDSVARIIEETDQKIAAQIKAL